jgi:MFS transporter, DHA1 family, multidrug resistance protein
MTLDTTARRRGLMVLLCDTFLMYAGFFMLVPLISIHYVQNLGFTAAAVGLVLAARQLTQQGLTLFGGALADRLGPKQLICWGIVIRTLSFAGLAWATTFPLLLLLCVLAAIGGALFDAPKSAATAALAEPAERNRFFGLQGIAGGVGMTFGPLVGSLLLPLDFRWVCYGSAVCFAVAGVITAIWLPIMDVPAEQQPVGRGIMLALRDRPFVLFTLLLGGFWFMWVQLSISLPLVAQRWGQPGFNTPFGALTINGVAWVYALNAGLTVVLQYPLLRLAERWLRPLPIVVCGTGLMALGLGLVALAGSFGTLLACVALFSLGALLVQPTQHTVTAGMADAQALGSYFGFSALALAFGGGLGNYLGGRLYDLAAAWQFPALPWLLFATVGLSVALGLVVLDRAQTHARTATPVRQPSSSV